MDRSINLGNIISIVTSDRQKLPARVLTGATVLLLIVAGSPFLYADTSSVDAAENPYGSISIFNQRNSEPTSSGSFFSGTLMYPATTGCITV
ncbi:hypothetical protein [Candidatus Methanoperedens nitratireducens]|uniref:Uncharacterized protein n=1 Tax=Candidatus Methanoperedens nitratireducens TaxID=1392998 RepID=A0A284VQU6_9EURY|nr:hypothetical protein [Candidatus Methanoperedens nitroreducens]SNQ61579.1 hypothetical protein MNV_40047 [Candidatus Methanoperedens nitroreducens]